MKQNKNREIISFSSVEQMPENRGSVLFINDSSKVFKDDVDISPITLPDGTQYMPWGGEGGEAEELGSAEVPHRGVTALLGGHLQAGAHHGHQETAGACGQGKTS